MLSILREKFHDNRFLRLLTNLFQAGSLEDWKYHKSLSGVPQEHVVGPILSSIYLDQLDQFVETTLLPAPHRGDHRKPYLPYMVLLNLARGRGLRKSDRAPLFDSHFAFSTYLPIAPTGSNTNVSSFAAVFARFTPGR
jgi:hypothetical protein